MLASRLAAAMLIKGDGGTPGVGLGGGGDIFWLNPGYGRSQSSRIG